MSEYAANAPSLGNREPTGGPSRLRTDTLADTVLVLLSLSVLQRLVGFGRAILFCRWLAPQELGQWDMAFNFLLLAAPVSVLALTSSFPRYAEHYSQRGQLRSMLRRTFVACALLGGAGAALVALAGPWFSQLVFGTPERADLVAVLAVALPATIAMHYFVDLFSALRNVRLIGGLYLANSLMFAALGIGLLLGWQCTALSVVVAYALATALAAAGGACWLVRNWRFLPGDAAPPPHRQFWSKLLPFAAWTWMSSMLANLFVIADRSMIVHYSSGSASDALARVGEYHSARVLPTLLVSIAMILSPMITAHWSHDWEAGRRDRVRTRLNLALKLFGFGLAIASVAILLAAPVLFRGVFQGKFVEGLAVLPWTLTYCVWFAAIIIAQSYLWCREKAYLSSLALLAGLGGNVGLNLLLLPRLGLLGAVLATTAANLLVLLLIASFNRRLGFRMDLGAWLVLLVPLLFWLGPWVTLAALAALVLQVSHSDRLLSREEKRQVGRATAEYWSRFRTLLAALRLAGRPPGAAVGGPAPLAPDRE